jgi:hypothetical protein
MSDGQPLTLVAGRYVIPTAVLKKQPRQAIALVRLGAIANAITAVASMSASSMATGVGQERDILQSILIVLSYVKEAIEVIGEYGRGVWDVIERGVAAGYQLPQPLDGYKKAFSKRSGSTYERTLKNLRHTKGFHFDDKHFKEWLDRLQLPEVTIWHKDSASPLDWAFTVSAKVQAFFGQRLDDETLECFRHAIEFQFLVEALAAGLVADAGYDPRAAWRATAYQRARIDYDFRDGRQRRSEHIVVAIDIGGGLTETGQDALLGHLYPIFGGKEHTGYRFSGDGALMHFSATGRGTAVIWPDGEPMIKPPRPESTLVVARLKDAASHGEQQALGVLKHLEKMRSGQITGDDAATAISELLANVDYWRNLRRIADEVIRTERA